jgi:hypothetical protein
MKALIRHRVAATAVARLLPGPTYLGACDASAAVAIGGGRFAIASDELCADGRQVLHVYDRDYPRPLHAFDLRESLGRSVEQEADIEAAVRVDGRIYWISSHGRSADGEREPGRCRFFATDLVRRHLEPCGKPYARLLDDMLAAEALGPLGLAELEGRSLAPKHGGLNIEGMTARPDGALLLGLRSPLLDRRAVLLPYLNPDAVLEGRERAAFDAPITLDLQGNGIRDVTYDPARRVFVVLGGASGRGHGRTLYVWSGRPADDPVPVDVTIPQDFNAEALFVDEQTGYVRVFSDDGTRRVDTGGRRPKENKALKDSRRSFRSLWLVLAEPRD